MRYTPLRVCPFLCAAGLVVSSCADKPTLKPPAQVTQCEQANALGLTVFQSGDVAIAFKHFNQALRRARSVDYREGVVASMNNIGAVYAAVQNRPKATWYFEQARDIAREVSDWHGLVSALDHLGDLERQAGAFDKAAELLHEASKSAQEHRLPALLANIHNHLGLVHLAQGQLDQAEAAFAQALRLHVGQDDLAGQAAAHSNLGAVQERRGDLDGAKSHYGKALALDKALGRVHAIADDLALLGNVAEAQRDLAGALSYYERAGYVINAANVLWKEEAIWRDVVRLAEQLKQNDKAVAAKAKADEIRELLAKEIKAEQGVEPKPRRAEAGLGEK